MDPLKADMGYLIGQTSRWLRALLSEELRFHGLDDVAYILLFYVMDAGDRGLGTYELSGRAEIPFEELDRTAQRLVRDGWLVEVSSPDRKERVVTPSAKTRTVFPVLRDAAHWSIEHALNGFTAEEIEELRSYLMRMQANLRES